VAPPSCATGTTLSFTPDTGAVSEAYVCFGFDAGALAGTTIGAVAWTPPPDGPFVLHHALLYAVPDETPDGPVDCAGMPASALGVDIWAPGAAGLVLPSDTGLLLPAGTRRLVVEAHVLRVGAGMPRAAAVTLCAGPSAPVNVAALIGMSAPVPAIRPHHVETSQGTCALAGAVHLFSVWPHMHLIGQDVTVSLLGAEAQSTPLARVDPWNFNAQSRYALDVDAAAGDRIQTTCVWNNTTDAYVFPGPLTENEMCSAALVAWPASSATCTTLPP
jgi:Copper type II ascorbate-dependent monooxygenase, C-terminal domain